MLRAMCTRKRTWHGTAIVGETWMIHRKRIAALECGPLAATRNEEPRRGTAAERSTGTGDERRAERGVRRGVPGQRLRACCQHISTKRSDDVSRGDP